ncbi:hypothetical protein OY671_008907, partial [Metschnikowia pulcherrima]
MMAPQVDRPSVKSAAMPDARIIPVGYPICLQATDPARNIARRYTILLQRDFFGAITVDYSWGRIGRTGQCRRVAFTDIDQAERFARKSSTRRESARKRIGQKSRHARGTNEGTSNPAKHLAEWRKGASWSSRSCG